MRWCRSRPSPQCGTIGLTHAVANTSTLTGGTVDLVKGGFFDRFVTRTLASTPEARAEEMEKDDGIDEAHETVAHEGQSAVIEDTWQHFIAFVKKGDHLYELDGRKDFPINHGPTTDGTILEDAVAVVKQFMARDPTELRFTVVALAANNGEPDEVEAPVVGDGDGEGGAAAAADGGTALASAAAALPSD